MADIQSTSSLLMVRPVSFGFDQETAQSNTFQHALPLSKTEMQKRTCDEFDGAVVALRNNGINVTVFKDAPLPEKPDAVFPNNWLSTWSDGTIYLYPMATESRRIERSDNALKLLSETWDIKHVIDNSKYEQEGTYLESTGVMIFDHNNKIVYGCLSVRCNETLFRQHAIELGYEPIVFHAVNETNVPIYHTNVLMGIQSSSAVVCLEAIKDSSERAMVEEKLRSTDHTVIPISYAQMNSFCGNLLEVRNETGERFIVLSQTAYDAFTGAERRELSKNATLLPITIPTIEAVGGGSARCMMAEIFLPRK
jgi:hypothetical protein